MKKMNIINKKTMQEQEMGKQEKPEKKEEAIKILKLILRLAIGGMFVTTAILKLFSLDEFELYIYSFDIFNYLWCTFFARCIIAFEFLLGFFLIIKFYYKYTWWLTMTTMVGFSLFLVYVAIFRNDSNCHCFGEFVELDPANSIIKNLITIVLLLFIRKEDDYKFRFKNLVAGIYFAVVVLVCFVLFPMDALYSKFVSPRSEINVDAFERLKNDTIIPDFNIDNGNYVVAFFISQCKYCKLSIKKIHSIIEKNQLDQNKIKIMISGSAENIEHFKVDSETFDYTYYKLPPKTSMDIVYGSFPTFVFVSNGEIVNATSLRGFDEKMLVDFLK